MSKRDWILLIFAILLCSISNAAEVDLGDKAIDSMTIGELAKSYESGSFHPLKEIVLTQAPSTDGSAAVNIPIPPSEKFLAHESALVTKINDLEEQKKNEWPTITISKSIKAAKNELDAIRREQSSCNLIRTTDALTVRINPDHKNLTYKIELDRSSREVAGKVHFRIVAMSDTGREASLHLICASGLNVDQIQAAFKAVLGVDLELQAKQQAPVFERTAQLEGISH